MADDPLREEIDRLALAFQDGDLDAFAALVDRLQDRLYRVAYRVVGQPEAALDVVQDAFVKIHDRVGSWDGRSSFTCWSYRVVTNLAIDTLRRRGRERKAWEARAAEQPDAVEDQSADSLEAQERASLVLRVKEAIAGLPPGQRAIVALRHYEGCSLKEIAEIRGCALGTVKSTLHQAFSSLRRSLGQELLQQVAAEQAT